MQLVGATSGFIRKPFVIKSALFGALGALFAILTMIIVIYFLQNTLEGIILIKDKWLIFGLMLVLGVFISGISTWLAVNRFLRLKTSDLYY